MKNTKRILAAALAACTITAALPLMADGPATTNAGTLKIEGNNLIVNGKVLRQQSAEEKKAIAYLVSMQGKSPDGKAVDTTKFANGDGAWLPEIGPAVTAMVIKTLIGSGMKVDDPILVKALKYIESTHKSDGGYYTQAVPGYNTAITLSMLAVLPQTDEVKTKIASAQKFLRGTQLLEGSKDKDGKEITKESPWYGGATYGGGGPQKPDLSNTSFFLDAMIDSGVSKDDPAVKAALVYVSRSQAAGETNDQAWAKELHSGGFIYTIPERAGGEVIKEYGSMTYAGLKSFIYAGLTKDDARVKAAMKWITGNWTLEVNPGLNDESALYYYYHTFARAMHAYGEDKIKDAKGVEHDWRADLAAALAKRQKTEGYFVNDKKDRWMENNPFLATAFATLAMQEARK